MNRPMLRCGHSANAVDEKGNPSCAICCTKEIDKNPPDLSARKARCTYFGSVPKGRNHESNYDCKRGQACLCERPSDTNLPFFHYTSKDFDEFYCGCWGWD